MKKVNLIYLLGAGRSGTTALATLLGNHKEVTTLGEMHQFYDHIRDGKTCSCGKQLDACSFWSSVLQRLPEAMLNNPQSFQNISDCLEYHSSIPKHLLGLQKRKELEEYNASQTKILKEAQQNSNSRYVLDSAKYIGRFLSLRKNKDIELKGIYMVRDVRGVIESFKKQVQTSRSPLSTIFYYSSVNTVAQWVYWRNRSSVLKIKYEDLIRKEAKTVHLLCEFLNLSETELITKLENKEPFLIGHIIGGNRIRKEHTITMNFSERWREQMPRSKQILYYFLCFPFMLLNRYKL